MAYFTPLQRKDGRWDYTCTNGAGTFPIGYCHEYRELKDEGVLKGVFTQPMLDRENAKTAPFREKYHANGHATSDEAMNCYREHQLDQHLEFDAGLNADSQKRCQICNEWTTGFAHITGESFRQWHLCDAHRNRESVEKLWPLAAEEPKS